jgi:NAD(P)-dependent dehydrogenase (short-subunit alcohol dehydrogenase family)
MEMKDTCAVITGGASGLGEATARVFADAGAKVTLLDRDTTRGPEVAAELGGTFVETDVTDEASVQNAFTTARETMGCVNAAVNCAGIVIAETVLKKDGGIHSLDSYRKVIAVNLAGTFNVARLAADAMKDNAPAPDGNRGVIINTASIAAFDGQRGQAAYASSKGGVVGLTLPMARDLARAGIRVMAIAPGVFMTPMLAELPQDALDTLAKDVTNPKRLGDPREYGQLAKFIVECGYLNGETIRIDGALRMM